jgi:hypothetical protein
LIEPIDDETVVYDLETKEAHCLKPAAAFVFEHANGERSLEEIQELARQRLDGQVRQDEIEAAVEQLEDISLLKRPLVVIENGISRRQMVRRVAYTGAAATMASALITSIAAPSAVAACTGQPAGCNCSQNKECASNHCCQAVADKCNIGCCASDNNGTECKCNTSVTPNVCNSIPTPVNCCLGVCTPSPGPC